VIQILARMQFSRFVLVGVASAIVYVVIANALLSTFAWSVWLASTVAYLICIPPAYVFQRRLAFRSRRSHISAFPRYCGTQAASIAISALASEGISRIPGLPASMVFALAAAAAVLFNYTVLSRWTFASR